ncbi:O-antigen ligase family protein, partial [Candidatus Sumerlaeota bacterium]|nr:O-antigen ligase family protein [Candidatus Sumerlaeota bacterium]
VGLLEIGYGLYQVAAGFANVKFGLSLPIGELGLFQADYVGMFFGRPYGTMPEADTYGCICLFYALLLGLMWLTGSTPPVGRRLCEVTAVAALAGLLIGIVRAVWLGFLGGLLCALLLWLTGRMRGFRTMRVAGVGGTLALLVFVLLAGSPNAREVLLRRFSRTGSEAAFSRENVRFLQMQISWRLFREAPLLGNGPGCFSVLGGIGIPEHELYYASTRFDLSRMYDPSLMTTVLDDTGLVGAAAFLLLIASYLTRVHRRARSAVNAVARNAVLSAHCAVVGMFVSFLFTHYFWSPFTWLFLAVAMLVLEFGNGGVGPVQATTSPRSANHLSNHQEARECTCG